MPNRRNYAVSLNGSYEYWSWVYGNNTYSQSSTNCKQAWRSATDYNRRKPIGRWLIPTTYSMSEVSQMALTGSCYVYDAAGNLLNWQRGSKYDGVSPETWMTRVMAATGLSESFPVDLSNRALINARSKLKSSDINYAVAFGERRQTARLVGNNLKRVGDMFKALKRNQMRELDDLLKSMGKGLPDRLVKDIPDAWLELQYGWKPLLSDIFGSVTALDQRDRRDWTVTVKGKASFKDTREVVLDSADTAAHGMRCTAEVFHGSMVRIDAVPSSTALASAASLGLTNPLSVAWELLPYSFVVDWAYPLGPYFDQLDALAGWEIRGTSTSNFSKVKWGGKGSSGAYNNNTPGWTKKIDANWYRRLVRLDRSSGTTVGFPVLPSIKDPFSQIHVANALSLLANAFRGGKAII